MIDVKLYADVRENSGCDYHRVALPLKYMDDIRLKHPVLFFNRFCRNGVDFIKKMKSQGVKIVVDVDDYHILTNEHPYYTKWTDAKMDVTIHETLLLADCIITSTDYLAYKISDLNKNIVVIPNALPFDQDQFTRSNDKHSVNRFVYVAGSSHVNDVKILPKMKEITLAGYSDSDEWKRMINDEFNVIPAKDIDSYMSLYNGHMAALAPLQNNVFNNCKSNLKLLEAGAKGLPLIASQVLPYWNTIDNKVIKYPNNWNNYLKHVSDDELSDLGNATSIHVRKHYDLKKANKIRRQVFESF